MKRPQLQPSFKLFKSSSSAPNAAPYSGSVLLEGKWYAIDAWVVEPNEDCAIKHFEGTVSGGQTLARQMVKSAKEKAPDDLLKALEDKPFDDIDALRKALPT